MKRVVSKITGTESMWQFSVSVDGEEYSLGYAPTYLEAVQMASGYLTDLGKDVEQVS